MKQEIIDQMQAKLGCGAWAVKDFEIDKEYLADYDGKFFWMSRENGTSLSKIDMDHIAQAITDSKNDRAEANRIAWFQDFYLFMGAVSYWSDPNAKLFYCDGNSLVETDLDNAKRIYEELLARLYREVCRDYKFEHRMANKRLPIKLRCKISKLKESLYYAESIGDTSLLDCLHRLRKYRRAAVSHCIEIYSDFTKHGFGFVELINGKYHLNGGIIMHDYMKVNRWNIHT